MIPLAQASNVAGRVDGVFLFIFAFCALFLVFLTALLVYFSIKYRRKAHPRGKDIEGNTWLEVTWTVVPLFLFMGMFYFGWTNYEYTRSAPRDAMVVKVTGRQWAWGFEYPNGKQTTELYLVYNRPVKLLIRSADVIHGFFVPAFRVKMDAVAGKENHTWFTPTQMGTFDIECTVICGTNHSYMLSHAVVVGEGEFKAWYFGGEDAPTPGGGLAAAAPSAPGEAPVVGLLRRKACLTCHSLEGRVMVGPSFKGAFGTKQVVRVGKEEREVVVDEPYLRKAIQDPLSEITKGYPPTMPPANLTAEELEEVVGYIKGLK